jgi:hypothetical protein
MVGVTGEFVTVHGTFASPVEQVKGTAAFQPPSAVAVPLSGRLAPRMMVLVAPPKPTEKSGTFTVTLVVWVSEGLELCPWTVTVYWPPETVLSALIVSVEGVPGAMGLVEKPQLNPAGTLEQESATFAAKVPMALAFTVVVLLEL